MQALVGRDANQGQTPRRDQQESAGAGRAAARCVQSGTWGPWASLTAGAGGCGEAGVGPEKSRARKQGSLSHTSHSGRLLCQQVTRPQRKGMTGEPLKVTEPCGAPPIRPGPSGGAHDGAPLHLCSPTAQQPADRRPAPRKPRPGANGISGRKQWTAALGCNWEVKTFLKASEFKL